MMSANDKLLRFGILGAGYMGQNLARLLGAIQGVSIAAVCAEPLPQAQALCERQPSGAKAFDDFDRMLAEVPLDALAIAIPPFAHTGQFEAAAAHRLPIFLEKPIALSVSRGRSMVEAATRARVLTQVGYHLRFLKSVRRLRALLDSGEAGRPTLFQGRWLCNSEHGAWWKDVSKSGGQILEQAIHTYDLALHLVGTDPVRVSGCLRNLQHRDCPGYTVEDTSAAVIQFASGALASVCASNAAVPGEWTSWFTLVCERLTVNYRQGSPTEFIHTGNGKVVRDSVVDDGDPYADEVAHFVATIRGQAPAISPVSEGLLGLRVVSAVAESSARHGDSILLSPLSL
jgi:predicted dehydrogenase